MDPEKKKRIIDNLDELVEVTFCSAKFLAFFRSRSVFSKSDVQAIETEERNKGPIAASSKFYDLLVSRLDSFVVLLDALQETKQTGVLDILNNVASGKNLPINQSRKRFTCKSPRYIDDYVNQHDGQYLIVCSDDCKLTCDWILESTANCKLCSVTDILEKLSDSIKPLDENSVNLVNLGTDLEPIHIIELNKPLKIVLVTQMNQSQFQEEFPNPTTAWKVVQDNIKYSDLSMSAKLGITSGLKQSLGLGGKELTESLSSLDTKTLVDLLKNKFPVPEDLYRETVPDMIDYYVPRTLQSRFVITNQIFDDNLKNDFVLFTGIDRVLLSQMCKKNVVETSSNVLRNKKPTSQFVFLECDIDFDSISNMFPKHPVHLLEYQDNELIWRKSRGNISSIQKYVSTKQRTLAEAEFLSGIFAQKHSCPICISDTPGKGKSIVLTKLACDAKKYHQTGIVAFITIKELIQCMKGGDISPTKTLSSISQFFSASTLSHVYLKSNTNFLRELLLEGFDEIRVEDTNFALKCVNEIRSVFRETRIWITSRPHMLPELENCLEVLGYNIAPFSRTDQITFLSSFWSSRIENCDTKILPQFADQCLKTLEASLTTTKEDIAGIPLQCLLIGEVYEDGAKRFLNVNSSTTKILSQEVTTIAVLYRKLIEKKLEKFITRYNSNNLSKSEIFKAHMLMALEILYPGQVDKFSGMLTHNMSQQEILDFGLIESKSILTTCEFLHRTFAEYFVASFVSELISNEPSDESFLFIFFDVMITEYGKGKVPIFLADRFLSVSKFRENVICYFLNTFLEEADVNVAEHVSSISLEFVRPVAEACVYHNFENLLRKIILESKHTRDVINEDLLVKAVHSADVHFLTEIMVKYQSIDGNTPILEIGCERIDDEGGYCRCCTGTNSPDCHASQHKTKIGPSYTLLHVAIMRADYATVDFLIKQLFQASVEFNSDNLYDNLIYTLINYSDGDVDCIVAEKRLILNYLATLNEDLLVSEGKSGFPLHAVRPNVELVFEIWKQAKRFYNKINTLVLLLQTFSENMPCGNFFTILKVVCSDLDSAKIEKVIKGYLWVGILLNHDLKTQFLFFLKDQSSGFCDLNSDERIKIFRDALYKGHKENILEWMLNNLPYLLEDIKQLFTHSLLVANLTGLNALSMYMKKQNSLEQAPRFYDIFKLLFSDQATSSNNNIFTILRLVRYFILKTHSNYFMEMDFETTLTSLIKLGFSFFEEKSLKSLLSKSDECILQLVWLIFICSDFKQEIFLKWLKIYPSKIDIKATSSSGNNLLHIFAQSFGDLEDNRIKNSFLDQCTFSRGFTEMYGDKNSKVKAIDIWKVLVENDLNILQPNINKQTPICLLPSRKYPNEICENVTDAIFSAANHMKTHHSDNIDNIHQIFYLVLKSHQIEVVQSVYEWYAEIRKSHKLSIANVTVSFDDEDGNFLDAAIKSGNGNVVEFVINTLHIHVPLLPPSKLCIHHSIESDTYYEYKRVAKYIKYLGKIFPSQIKQLVNEPNDRGLNPLSLASKEVDSDIVKVLHDFGANVNAADDNGNTILHFTLMYKYFEDVLKQFIECGSHINAQNFKMETPLSTFVQNQNNVPDRDIISRKQNLEFFLYDFETLLGHKADPSIPDKNGNTPVHFFVQKIYTGFYFHRLVKILIFYNFVHVLTMRNQKGETPLQIADEYFNINKATKLLLTQHGIVNFEV